MTTEQINEDQTIPEEVDLTASDGTEIKVVLEPATPVKALPVDLRPFTGKDGLFQR